MFDSYVIGLLHLIWCYIIPMNAAHVVLSRSWLFPSHMMKGKIHIRLILTNETKATNNKVNPSNCHTKQYWKGYKESRRNSNQVPQLTTLDVVPLWSHLSLYNDFKVIRKVISWLPLILNFMIVMKGILASQEITLPCLVISLVRPRTS